jgi:hypothetical protein
MAHLHFWRRHARLLHMRNAMADANDLRVLRYRNEVTRPLIALLAGQISSGDGPGDTNVASVMMTGLERVATVVTNPQFRIMAGVISAEDQQTHTHDLVAAEAEVISVVIAHRRALAARLPQLHRVATR